MRDLLVTLVVFGSLPIILKRPYVGVLMWCWLSYMNPHRMAWGFAYSMPFAAMVAGCTVIGLLMSNQPKRLPITPITVALVLFLGWMAITTVFATEPEAAFLTLKRVLKIQFMTFITLMLMGSKKHLDLMVWTIFLSLGYFGIKGGVFTLATGGSFTVWGPPDSFVEGNNELALALLMLIPLGIYLRTISENIWVKRGLIGAMALMGISAIGSQSRGALLAGMSMLFYLWLKSKNKFVTGFAGCVFLIPLLAFMPQTWYERMGTIQTYDADASAMGRINAWWVAYNVAKTRLTGGGYEHWTEETFALYAPDPMDVHDAHSIYFEVLGEHGFVGLLLFLAIGGLSLYTSGWISRTTRDIKDLAWANQLSRMLYVSLVAYATGGAFLGLAYFDLYYHLIAMLVLTRVIVEERLGQTHIPVDEVQETVHPIQRSYRKFVRPVRKESQRM